MIQIISFILILGVVVGFGHSLSIWANLWKRNDNVFLKLGTGYFIGSTSLIVLVVTASHIIVNAIFAARLVLLAFLICCMLYRSALLQDIKSIPKTSLKLIFAGLILAVTVIMFLSIHSPEANSDNPFASIGTLHSVRYAWIANLIAATQKVPILGQNFGQSILTFVLGTVVTQMPYFYLFAWLILSKLFMSLMVFGTIVKYFPGQSSGKGATLLFLFGGTALSISHILTVDSGVPLGFNAYTDTTLGIMSILFFILIEEHLSFEKMSGPLFSLTTLVLIGNFFFSPQNIILLIGYIPVKAILNRSNTRTLSPSLIWLLALVSAAIVSIPQGGMLTPHSFRTLLNYSGLMVSPEQGSTLLIDLGVAYHWGYAGEWRWGLGSEYQNFKNLAEDYSRFFGGIFLGPLWLLESIGFNSLRILFFPILGLVVLIRSDVKVNEHQQITPFYTKCELGRMGCTFMFFGFLISFIFKVSGYKWELVRFLIPGIVIGMIGISTFAISLWSSVERAKKVCGALLIFLMLFGPTFSILSHTVISASGAIRHYGIRQYLSEFLGSGPKVVVNEGLSN